VSARPLHVRPVPLGRRVVDRQQRPRLAPQRVLDHQDQQPLAQFHPAPPDALQEEVVVLVVVADAARPNPGRDAAPAAGEQRSQQQCRQPPARSSMQSGGQPVGPIFPFRRSPIRCHPWLSGATLMSETISVCPKSHIFDRPLRQPQGQGFLRKCRPGHSGHKTGIAAHAWPCGPASIAAERLSAAASTLTSPPTSLAVAQDRAQSRLPWWDSRPNASLLTEGNNILDRAPSRPRRYPGSTLRRTPPTPAGAAEPLSLPAQRCR